MEGPKRFSNQLLTPLLLLRDSVPEIDSTAAAAAGVSARPLGLPLLKPHLYTNFFPAYKIQDFHTFLLDQSSHIAKLTATFQEIDWWRSSLWTPMWSHELLSALFQRASLSWERTSPYSQKERLRAAPWWLPPKEATLGISIQVPNAWPSFCSQSLWGLLAYIISDEEREILNYLLVLCTGFQPSPADTRACSPNHWVFCTW